jgi:hypothetical protein
MQVGQVLSHQIGRVQIEEVMPIQEVLLIKDPAIGLMQEEILV